MNTFVHLWQCSAELFLDLEMSPKKKVAKNIKPRFMSNPPPENHAACEVMWKIL